MQALWLDVGNECLVSCQQTFPLSKRKRVPETWLEREPLPYNDCQFPNSDWPSLTWNWKGVFWGSVRSPNVLDRPAQPRRDNVWFCFLQRFYFFEHTFYSREDKPERRKPYCSAHLNAPDCADTYWLDITLLFLHGWSNTVTSEFGFRHWVLSLSEKTNKQARSHRKTKLSNTLSSCLCDRTVP